MKLYRSDRGLWPFQIEHTAEAYNKECTLLVWDCGLGKSHAAMALSALLLEDDAVDLVLLCCEKGKLDDDEWPAELDKYTSIDWKAYKGTPKQRSKLRESLPQLLLASYDTIKRDCAIFPKSELGNDLSPLPGPFTEALAGKRVLVIWDETARVSNRKSLNHKAHKLLIETLREVPGFKHLILTATPMETSPESYYNLARILLDTYPNVKQFGQRYVSAWDGYDQPWRFKNLTPDDCQPGVAPLSSLLLPLTLRKRKSDSDVVDFFPKHREMPPTFMKMGELQQKFYNAIEELADNGNEKDQRAFGTILRMVAAHPASLLTSHGELAQGIVEAVTPEGILQIPSVKTEKLIEWCNTVVTGQGAQAVVFTFFAQSVLPLLETALVDAKFTVSVYHGELSDSAKSLAKRTFKNGETQIFLTGDSAQKGVNLPNASYLLHYERPSKHTAFVQRSERIDRIDSLMEAVFIYSFVVHDSIEEGLYNLGLRRNEWSDKLVDDGDFENDAWISAADRKQLFKLGRKMVK